MAVQEMLSGSILITKPIHLHHLRMMIVPMLSRLQQVRRWWLEMVSGPNINRILLRFLVCKEDSLLRSLSIVLQHSEPYSRVESMQLRYSLNLVLVLYWDGFHDLVEAIPDVCLLCHHARQCY